MSEAKDSPKADATPPKQEAATESAKPQEVRTDTPKDAQEPSSKPEQKPHAKLKGVPPSHKTEVKPVRAKFPVDMKGADKFKSLDRIKEDAFLLNPAKQSGGSPKRIFKLAAALAAVVAIAAIALLAWSWLEAEKEKAAKLEAFKETLSKMEAAMANLSGFDKERAAMQAYVLTQKALRIDRKGQAFWTEKASSLKSAFSESFPVLGMPKGQPFIVPSALTEMAYIPQSRFFMGRRSYERGNSDELPRHAVTIPYEYWIARTETTNAQMRLIAKGFHTPVWKTYSLDADSQPAAFVDWNAAMAFCKAVTEAEKAESRLPEGYEYRLPTEAEWECAARAGTETYYFWGDQFGDQAAKFANSVDKRTADIFEWKGEKDMASNDGYVVSAPVASYQPNAFGLYDMSGNVWEWCYDWYSPNAYRELPEKAPFQAIQKVVKLTKTRLFDAGTYEVNASCRVIRGGAWATLPSQCRSATRDYLPPTEKSTDVGFRMVLAPAIKAKAPAK